ncbi:MAG: YolD-like family protein [Acholeplasmataceae bacterium]|jgi:hypothetical protein|nr:YolD-like family protein [Acholeplasmataceae bacterium]
MHKHTYVDRGIIKWAPFDALVGFHGILSEMRHQMFKTDKPTLSDDQFQELNQKLNLAFQLQLEVHIVYFADGYTKTTFGMIKKIDWIQHLIIFSHFEKISAEDILDITIESL